MVDVKLLKIAQNLVLDVRYELLIILNRIEPCLQVRAIPIAVDNQVQLDVRCARYAQTTTRKIGAPDDRVLTPTVINKIHFAMYEVRIEN